MRVSFLVDGFNLYHSIKAAERRLGGSPLRWLDLRALCETLLRSGLGPTASLESVHYFSALARHLEGSKPDVVRRHRTYVAALESSGVEVTLAKFKRKDRLHRLADCRVQVPPFRRWWRLPVSFVRLKYRTHEEKETDVAIACTLLQLLCQARCDAAVLLSGDTDLAPAIRTAKILYPAAPIIVAFPFDRHNHDLGRLVTRTIKINAPLYRQHQFPPTVVGPSQTIVRPSTW